LHLDKSYVRSGEMVDLELCMSLKKRNWKIYYCPIAEAVHWKSQTAGTLRDRGQTIRKNQETFYRRWTHAIQEEEAEWKEENAE